MLTGGPLRRQKMFERFTTYFVCKKNGLKDGRTDVTFYSGRKSCPCLDIRSRLWTLDQIDRSKQGVFFQRLNGKRLLCLSLFGIMSLSIRAGTFNRRTFGRRRLVAERLVA